MFVLNLVTPEKKLVTGEEIEEIFVPAYRGELNVLPGHAPLMTTLNTGVLKYRLKGQAKLNPVAISWGYCQVSPNGINILAETAERPEDIDIARASEALKEAEEKLGSTELDSSLLGKYQLKIARALVRKEVAAQGDGKKSNE